MQKRVYVPVVGKYSFKNSFTEYLNEPRGQIHTRGRWGEVDKEKGPVDLFSTEPTDEAIYGEETLNFFRISQAK